MSNASLPPPPTNPVRPPAVELKGEQLYRLETADGVSLEALVHLPAKAERSLVLCHPHPLYGGTMHNALIATIARMAQRATSAPIATIRFNFRGVEGSSGVYDGGRGEKLDVLAAVDGMRNELPSVPVTVIGYSFGSWVGLRASWEQQEVDRAVLIAPAIRMLRYEETAECRRPLPVMVLIGDHDDFATVEQARELASWLQATLLIEKEADHFFVGRRRHVGQQILPFAAPEAVWLT